MPPKKVKVVTTRVTRRKVTPRIPNPQRVRRAMVVTRKRMEGQSQNFSACAAKYLRVLENPFSGETACVPTSTNFPTMKHSVRTQGTFAQGAAGTGFVMFNPWNAFFNNGGPGGFGQAVYYTDATYAGTVFATTGTGVNAAASNSPYVNTLTTTQFEARLVGAGVRVRNVTPYLSAGGSAVGIESLTHTALTGSDLATCMLQDTADRVSTSPTSGWHSVVFHPQDEDEYDYFGASEFGQFQTFSLGFISNAPNLTNLQLFEFECYSVFEAKGNIVRGLTPSMSDPVGLATIQNSTAHVTDRKPKGNRAAWVGELVGRIVGTAGAVATGVGRGALTSYSGALVGNNNLLRLTAPSNYLDVD